MENFGEFIWFVAYWVQMIGLVAGFALVGGIFIATLYEIIRRKVGDSRMPTFVGHLEQAERA